MAGVLDVAGSSLSLLKNTALAPVKVAAGTVGGAVKGTFSGRALVGAALGAGIGAVVGMVGGPPLAAVAALKGAAIGGALLGTGVGAVAGGGKAALNSTAAIIGGPLDNHLGEKNKAQKKAIESAQHSSNMTTDQWMKAMNVSSNVYG